ncbi:MULTISPECIES: hypothetical protein [Streptomyces]|uniref:Uncharacterized protein n=1 Tax=Streptomyces typhae TaxID=2681492 RepID=A0A6L6WVV6_9ACTN|nr:MULTISPECIES: hypothetical protein [Streptomyces]MVO84546.1 hypothetical protein [Streptomyces typhae]
MGVVDHEWIADLQRDGRYTRLLQLLERKAWQRRLAQRMHQLIAQRRADGDVR